MSDAVARLNAALDGRYAIERELGEGGMATVYLAEDIKHDRIQRSAVSRAIPTEAAMPRLDSPLEAAKTILARSTCRRGSVRDRTQDSRIPRSPRRSGNFLVIVAMDTNIAVHGIVPGFGTPDGTTVNGGPPSVLFQKYLASVGARLWSASMVASPVADSWRRMLASRSRTRGTWRRCRC